MRIKIPTLMLIGLAASVVLASLAATAQAQTVYVYNLQATWGVPGDGGGGVYSAYVGPPAYGYVSPGSTAVYSGRSAGIIKAGLTVDPTSGVYEDEGLFAFRPSELTAITINSFAASPLTYDVVNQYGTNPVWMTIEIDTGVPGVRADNTAFQMVPPPYGSAAYVTVDAGAATNWLQWTTITSGITTGSPRTLSDIAADPLYTGLNVVRTYLRLGMGDSYGPGPNGTQGWVDKTSIGGVTYDFVVLNVPTAANQCKNGGWQARTRSDGSPFRNQGDCIQYVNNGH